MIQDLIFQPSEVSLKGDAFLGGLLRQCEEKEAVFHQELVGWLKELRQRGAYYVVQSDLPTKDDEEWRLLDLSEMTQIGYQVAKKVTLSPLTVEGFLFPETQDSRLVFVNGVFSPEFSRLSALPEGVYVGNLSDLPIADAEKIVKYLGQQEGITEVFRALNTSGLTDVGIIWCNAEVLINSPIQVLYLTITTDEPCFTQPRTLIVAEKGSKINLIEHYGAIAQGCSDTPILHPYFTNGVTEVFVGENAEVIHTRIQRESGDGFHIGTSSIEQQRNSRYTIHEVNFGAKLSRHNLTVYQQGEQTETHLNGLTLIGEKQVSDTHTAIRLNKPHGTTNQLHKCIVDGSAHSIFNGKVFVPKSAQLTNAQQLNRNLLLSNKARVDTKPELQITADNVKCTHGATVSQLEADQIFYLRSRGLNDENARHLLIDAFAKEILDKIPLESLRHRLSQCVACRVE